MTIIIICVRCNHHHDDNHHHLCTMRSSSRQRSSSFVYDAIIIAMTIIIICVRCDHHHHYDNHCIDTHSIIALILVLLRKPAENAIFFGKPEDFISFQLSLISRAHRSSPGSNETPQVSDLLRKLEIPPDFVLAFGSGHHQIRIAMSSSNHLSHFHILCSGFLLISGCGLLSLLNHLLSCRDPNHFLISFFLLSPPVNFHLL